MSDKEPFITNVHGQGLAPSDYINLLDISSDD